MIYLFENDKIHYLRKIEAVLEIRKLHVKIFVIEKILAWGQEQLRAMKWINLTELIVT